MNVAHVQSYARAMLSILEAKRNLMTDENVIWEGDRVSWEKDGPDGETFISFGEVAGFKKQGSKLRVVIKSDSGAILLKDAKDLTKL